MVHICKLVLYNAAAANHQFLSETIKFPDLIRLCRVMVFWFCSPACLMHPGLSRFVSSPVSSFHGLRCWHAKWEVEDAEKCVGMFRSNWMNSSNLQPWSLQLRFSSFSLNLLSYLHYSLSFHYITSFVYCSTKGFFIILNNVNIILNIF